MFINMAANVAGGERGPGQVFWEESLKMESCEEWMAGSVQEWLSAIVMVSPIFFIQWTGHGSGLLSQVFGACAD